MGEDMGALEGLTAKVLQCAADSERDGCCFFEAATRSDGDRESVSKPM
jgi:hypothetical protein